MYDVWFISYDEPNAEENWQRAQAVAPRACRLHGVPGLVRAYRTAAFASGSDWFFVVDGDNWLLEPSVFAFTCPDSTPNDHLFVWPARNSINGLEYGNGAVKLYNRAAALQVPDGVEDFSIAVCTQRTKLPLVASETRIHGSPWQAWRAGFREGFKLHRRIEAGEGNARAQYAVWTTRGAEVRNGEYAIAGAKMGYAQFELDPAFPINDRPALQGLFAAWQRA
jgi:hypothetical protein